MKIILALSLFFSFNLYAADWFEIDKVPGENKVKKGKSLQENKSGKTENGFSAMIALTDELGIIQRWEKPSEGFSIKTAKNVVKGQYFLPLIFFRGAKTDSSGNTKVSYVLRVVKPDGQSYLEEVLEGWTGKASPAMNLVKGYLKMSFDPPDQFGTYKYIAYVRDEIGNTQLTIESEIELMKDKKAVKKLITEAELNNFLSFYYDHKNLKNLVPALQKLDQTPGFSDRNVPLMHFLEHIFANNPKKIISWENDFSKLTPTMQQFIWDAMWLSRTSEGLVYLKNAKKRQNERNQKYINDLLGKEPFVLLNQPVLDAHDLDKNWISFFASGNPEYVYNVISGLDFNSGNSHQRVLMKATASFSLTSNCEQHKRVKSILSKYIKTHKTRFTDAVRDIYNKCSSKS